MIFTKFGDAASIMTGGWSVFRYWKKQYLRQGMSVEEANKKAILKFEIATKRAQQAGDVEDLGELQRQGSWQKLFTMFMTQPKQYFSNASAAFRNILYKRGKLHKNLKRLLFAHFLLPVFFQFVSDGFRWDKDKILRAALLGSFNGILIAGDILETLLDSYFGDVYWQTDETPIGSIANELQIAIKKLSNMVDNNQIYLDEALETVDAIADATSKPFGIPYQPTKKVVKGIMDFSDAPDETTYLRLFGYPASLFEKKEKDPMIEDIENDQKQLNRLKVKARDSKDPDDIQEAKDFETRLNLKKQKSEAWKNFKNQEKQDLKEKRKNDPFIPPAKPKSKLGKFLKKPRTGL
jgi:hypothetical protein